jgi:hypothetical protein
MLVDDITSSVNYTTNATVALCTWYKNALKTGNENEAEVRKKDFAPKK